VSGRAGQDGFENDAGARAADNTEAEAGTAVDRKSHNLHLCPVPGQLKRITLISGRT
jgi:hypothetical protein